MTVGEQQSSEMQAEVRIATYREIADHFGLGSPDAARIRAKRSRWEREPTNHPLDPARVRVPMTAWEQPPTDQTRSASADRPLSELRSGKDNPNRSPPISSPKSDPIKSLSEAVEILREQLAREGRRAEAAEREGHEQSLLADQRVKAAEAQAAGAIKDTADAREDRARLQGELEAVRLALTTLQEQRSNAQ